MGLGLLSSVLTSSFAMDSKPLLMRRGADGDLHCTSAANKMKDAPASRGHMRCLTLLVQLTLWLFCRSTAYACVGCLRDTLASQVVLDPSHSGSWRDTRGRASRVPWQPSTRNVPVWLDRMPAGWGFPAYCTTGCVQCSSCHGGLQPLQLVKLLPCLPSCSDRLKLRPLAKQMFSSSMLSELQLNRTTATSNCASASTCLPERKDALPTSATSNWSYALGNRSANMWIWRPWTEGLERWKHSYNSSCFEPQASSGTRWNNSSGGCACPTDFCRHRFSCDAALLSHARPNAVFISACDASFCTQLRSCVKLRSLPAHRWSTSPSDLSVFYWCLVRSVKSSSSIRQRLFLRPGDIDLCALLPRLEESSPGAYSLTTLVITVVESCCHIPRLEVSSPGARSSAELADCCHWLTTPCCRLEVSSPATQWPASASGTPPDSALCRSWCLPPGRGLNHSCFHAWPNACTNVQITSFSLTSTDLLPLESAAQWVYLSSPFSVSDQLCNLAWPYHGSLLMKQSGLDSVPPRNLQGWTPEPLHTPLRVPCQNGPWKPVRLDLPRGHDCYHRRWQARHTRKPHPNSRKMPRKNLGPSFHLLWPRRVCCRPRHHLCLTAATTAPWNLHRPRLQWGHDPDHIASLRSGPPAPSPATPANDFISPPSTAERVHIFVPGPRAPFQPSWRYTISVQMDQMPAKAAPKSKAASP